MLSKPLTLDALVQGVEPGTVRTDDGRTIAVVRLFTDCGDVCLPKGPIVEAIRPSETNIRLTMNTMPDGRAVLAQSAEIQSMRTNPWQTVGRVAIVAHNIFV